MAEEYILLVDESKVVEKLEFKYPVVLEIIPESFGVVEKNRKKLGGKLNLRTSSTKNGVTISDYGLYLVDVTFHNDDIEDISKLDEALKKMVGVVDTSLFYNIATKAIIAGQDGIRLIERG